MKLSAVERDLAATAEEAHEIRANLASLRARLAGFEANADQRWATERARADAAEARVRDSDAYLTREVEAHRLTLDRAIRAEAERDEAVGLLRRWVALAVLRWTDHRTTGLVADSRALLSPQGAAPGAGNDASNG